MQYRSFVAEDILKMKFPGQPKLSPSGKEFLFVQTEMLEKDNTYSSSIYRFDGQKVSAFTNRGGQRKVREGSPVWSPDGQMVAFLSNRSGSNQLWVLDLHGGEATRLTDMPKGVGSFVWAPNGQGIYFVAKEVIEEPKFREGSTVRRITKLRYKFNGVGYLDNHPNQIWFVDLQGNEVEQLTTGNFHATQPAPSPCGKCLAFVSNRDNDELKTMEDLWLLSLETGELKNMTNGHGPVRSPMWTPEGTLLYTGHRKGIYPGAYSELREIDLLTGEDRNLMPDFKHLLGNSVGADTRFDSGNTGPVLSDDGRLAYFVATVGGNSYLFRLERASGRVEQVFGEGQMCITSFDVAAGIVVANVCTPAVIGNFMLGPVGDLKQVTSFNAELFADKYIGWPEPIYFTHADGTVLEGWLIKPAGFETGKQFPLVMEIHGGPHATFGNAFFHEFQMLAGHGMGVFYSNPRGSLGYGEEFARACVGDWCGIDANDLQFMGEEVSKLSWVDATHIGVTGGSQGGYFTNWLIGHTSMFAAAVTQRSMSNLYSKYGVADNGWNGDRYGMGGRDLWDDEDFVMERSPVRYARNVKTPTLIIHSDEDYRCPLEQAEQWYVALKRLGVVVEMLLFHGENHELSRSGRPANRIVRLEGILDWFSRYLLV